MKPPRRNPQVPGGYRNFLWVIEDRLSFVMLVVNLTDGDYLYGHRPAEDAGPRTAQSGLWDFFVINL